MNKVNSLITLIITFGIGFTCGSYTAKYSYDQTQIEPNELREQIVTISESQVNIQKSFLHFYVNDYCEDAPRLMKVKAFGVLWNGMYCDKGTVLVLSDDHPLPIGILDMNMETDNDND
jgi:hypothetical protein